MFIYLLFLFTYFHWPHYVAYFPLLIQLWGWYLTSQRVEESKAKKEWRRAPPSQKASEIRISKASNISLTEDFTVTRLPLPNLFIYLSRSKHISCSPSAQALIILSEYFVRRIFTTHTHLSPGGTISTRFVSYFLGGIRLIWGNDWKALPRAGLISFSLTCVLRGTRWLGESWTPCTLPPLPVD